MTAPSRLSPTIGDRLPAIPGRRVARQLRMFVLVGIASTAAYAALFTILRAFTTAGPANAVALIVTAVGNTAANRRLTFGVRGRGSLLRDHFAGLAAFAVALAITSGAISLLAVVAPTASQQIELVVLVGANGVATVLRFLLLGALVDRDRTVPVPATDLILRPERSPS